MSDLDLLGPHYFWLLVDDDNTLDEKHLLENDLLLEGDNVAILKRNPLNMTLLSETVSSDLRGAMVTLKLSFSAHNDNPQH
jgi:hypothetical protein